VRTQSIEPPVVLSFRDRLNKNPPAAIAAEGLFLTRYTGKAGDG